MRVGLFGGVRVLEADGRSAEVRGPRIRLLLALLGSRAGQPVSDDTLVEAIWGDDPPRSARTALQTYVSELRDVLEPERPRRSEGRFIARSSTGYVLVASPDDLDLVAFDDLVARAHAIVDDDPLGSMALLDEALALWSEPVLGEFADESWALATVARRREERGSVLESRMGLALDHGCEAEVLPQVTAASAEHPYRERLAGQVALAHYRAGRQREALRILSQTRERIREDLGLEPGRELDLLESAILRHDPELRRRGDHRRATTERARPARELIGRDAEIAEVAELVDLHRCVTITGTSGTGKSTLASEVARRWSAARGGQVLHVDLAEITPGDLRRSIARAAKVVEHPLAPVLDSLVDAIGDQPTLLVIDTCEADPDEVGRTVAALLRAPGLRVLATSHLKLGLVAEVVVPLGPLAPEPAVELLTRTWRAERAERHQQALEVIADRLDRLPLALELAGGLLATHDPLELERILSRDLTLLAGAHDRPERQRSVLAAAEWSLDQLADDERILLERLAVHTAPFSADVAATLWGTPPLDPDRVHVLIGSLVARSLVSRVDDGRFRLLNTVRSVVTERRTDDAAHDRLVEVLTSAALGQNLAGRPPDLGVDDLAGEVLAVLDRLHLARDPREVLLSGLLGFHFAEQGAMSAGREVLDRALAAGHDVSDATCALAATQAAFLAWYQGDLHATHGKLAALSELVERSDLALLRPAVDGCVAFVERRYDDAVDHLGRAADSWTGPVKVHLVLLHMSGNAALYARDLDEAARRYRAQRRLADEVGDEFSFGQALRFEAIVAAEAGEIESAWRWAEQSISLARRSAGTMGRAQASAAAAVVAAVAGDVTTALSHARDAMQVARRHFDVFALRTSVPIAAWVHLQKADDHRAARLLGWYQGLVERTEQTAWPTIGELVDDAIHAARSRLGATEFARTAASGAALSLPELIATDTAP